MIDIQIRINHDMRMDIEKYIRDKGLDKYGIQAPKIATLIVKEWLEDPKLNKKRITYNGFNYIRSGRITILLTEKEHEKLNEIFKNEYKDYYRTTSILIYNVIKQFIENNNLEKEII